MIRPRSDYKIDVEIDEEGMIVASVPDLPGCVSQGKTLDEACRNIGEAIELHLESLLAHGEDDRLHKVPGTSN